jgi:hypothetical protein
MLDFLLRSGPYGDGFGAKKVRIKWVIAFQLFAGP